jgi:hypothetical protein
MTSQMKVDREIKGLEQVLALAKKWANVHELSRKRGALMKSQNGGLRGVEPGFRFFRLQG